MVCRADQIHMHEFIMSSSKYMMDCVSCEQSLSLCHTLSRVLPLQQALRRELLRAPSWLFDFGDCESCKAQVMGEGNFKKTDLGATSQGNLNVLCYRKW